MYIALYRTTLCYAYLYYRHWVLAKGSPEAIGALLQNNAKPADYSERAAVLSKQGMRVLALAYKKLDSDTQVRMRDAFHAMKFVR